jgi:periplasmic protein TonB
MKKIYFITIFLLCLIVKGEAQQKVLIVDSTDSPFTRVEVEAEFPGGSSEWKKYLQKNLNPNVPADNKARRGKYMVVVRFIVAKDGSISEVVAETNHGYGMEKEVVRVIKIGPKWIPAMQNGNVVKAYRRQPVTFLVE